MQESDAMLLNIADEFLTPHSRARKRELQKQITARREIKTPLLQSQPLANDDPRGVTAGTRFEAARRARLNRTPSLADDQKNRFERHQEVVNAQRRDTTTHDSRVEERENQRQRWNHLRDTPKPEAVIKRELAKLRAASKQPPRTINLSTLKVCVWAVMQTHAAEFFDSEFNAEMLNRMIQHLLKAGGEVCPELVEEAYRRCAEGHHFELAYTRDPATGARITKRGSKPLTPPTPVQPCVWPDEVALIAEQERDEVARVNSAEAQRALKMAFDDLQKRVRQNFRPPRPGAPGDGGVR